MFRLEIETNEVVKGVTSYTLINTSTSTIVAEVMEREKESGAAFPLTPQGKCHAVLFAHAMAMYFALRHLYDLDVGWKTKDELLYSIRNASAVYAEINKALDGIGPS